MVDLERYLGFARCFKTLVMTCDRSRSDMLTAKSLLNADFEQWKMIARQASTSSSVVFLIEEITQLLS